MNTALNKKYSHFIWDWNGTLIDDLWLAVEIANNMLTKRGLKLMTDVRYKRLFCFPIKKYYENIGLFTGNETFEYIAEEFIEEYNMRFMECTLHNGALEVLQQIKISGATQSVLSATKEDKLHNIIEVFNLTGYFEKLNGLSDNYAGSKIQRGIDWINELGIDKEKVVMIGDTVHDYEAAADMGIDAILISNGHNNHERLVETGAVVTDDIRKIMEYIDNK